MKPTAAGAAQTNRRLRFSTLSDVILGLSHLCALAAGVVLLVMASIDTFDRLSLAATPRLLRVQWIICLVLLADLIIETILRCRSWRQALTAVLFVPVCLPWVNILLYEGIRPDDVWQFVLGLAPVVRVMAVLTSEMRLFHISAAPSMLSAYLLIAGTLLYVSTMMFYVAEAPVNDMVHTYRSAVYWGAMAFTTTGSNIPEVTVTGKVLAGVLAATGLILLPVFTIYIANAVGGGQPKNQS